MGDLSLYDGDAKNVKLTYAQDFELLSDKPTHRFGTGFDCHKLVENRKLILGGVTIPHDKGLLGHSDADVLTHAIMDAILSSLSLRDIGYHFSDKDPKYKDADSMKLLSTVLEMVDKEGYKVESISATIMAEKPKLLPHIPSITKNLADALSLQTSLVGIGATTLEGLGFVGREEGICVHATAVLVKK
ncbi:MAG: 2-C-methyl-D-erythritol 2,4-cyclodiphosphate synthase [Clostridia bacterium]|nr:2-C-methyl-D-erythritol 2,4-cyclodiphosphate synthase [Clostridia bacterium]